jgi:hypothetical protein
MRTNQQSEIYTSPNNEIVGTLDDFLAPDQIPELIFYQNFKLYPALKNREKPTSGSLAGRGINNFDVANTSISATSSSNATAPIFRNGFLEMNGVGSSNKEINGVNYSTIFKNADNLTYFGLIKLDVPNASLIHPMSINNSVSPASPRFLVGFNGNALRIRTNNKETTALHDWLPTYTMPTIGNWFVYYIQMNCTGRILRASIDYANEVSTTPSWTAGAIGNFNSNGVSMFSVSGTATLSNYSIAAQCIFKNKLFTANEKLRVINYLKS